MMLNYMKKSVLETVLVGLGEKPRISLENDGILYFKPTCKNNISEQTYEIVNMTRTRVDYEWKIPYESKELFSVDQLRSHLEPFEKKVSSLKFQAVDSLQELELRFFLDLEHRLVCGDLLLRSSKRSTRKSTC